MQLMKLNRAFVLLGASLSVMLSLMCWQLERGAAAKTFAIGTTWHVTNTSDSGAGSLRQAIADATAGDTIDFQLSGCPCTITLGGSELVLDKNLTITGPGAKLLTISGNQRSRIFTIANSATGNLSGLTLADGALDGNGGAIRNDPGGRLNLTAMVITRNTSTYQGGGLWLRENSTTMITDCLISHNVINFGTAAFGVGIYNAGTLQVANSTISGHTGFGTIGGTPYIVQGSGIYQAGNAVITNSTITDNVGSAGVGVFTEFGRITTVRNTIIAGNKKGENYVMGGDVAGTFTSDGYNLIGNVGTATGFTAVSDQVGSTTTPLNPKLGLLQDNGGPTLTYLPLPDSPVIDRGNSFSSTTDQRGFTRTIDLALIPNASGGDGTDIGAVEFQPTRYVTNTNNSGAGSLRQAVESAASGEVIGFQLSGCPCTITLTTEQLLLDKALTIAGLGANQLTISGNNHSHIFGITARGTVTLSGLTLTNAEGRQSIDAGPGGAINLETGALNLIGVALTNNNATAGGGLSVGTEASATIVNSLISGNIAQEYGGGIYNAGTLQVTNSTISGNIGHTAESQDGGGIYQAGTAIITSSTITNNTSPTVGGVYTLPSKTTTVRNTLIARNGTTSDVKGVFISQGYNLIGDVGAATGFTATGDQVGNAAAPIYPQLGILQNNGGQTPTHALLFGSPALDKGKSFGLTDDQRGKTRPFDQTNVPDASDGSDIGAFESQGICSLLDLTPTALPNGTVGTAYSQILTATGGVAPYNFVVNGLPNGLTMTVTDNQITILGTPTQTGSFNFTVGVTDSNDCNNGTAFLCTLTINKGTLTVRAENKTKEAGATLPTLTYVITGFVNSDTAAIVSGAPTLSTTATANSSVGLYPITIAKGTLSAANYDFSFVSGTLTVICPSLAATIPTSLPNGAGGAAYNASVAASPSGIYRYAVTGNFPNGLTLNADTGAITGTPSLSGTFNFTITATRYGSCVSSRAYTVTIACPTLVDVLPKPTGLMMSPAYALPTATVGSAYVTTITVTPASGAPVFTVIAAPHQLPAGLALSPDPNDANKVKISGLPMATGTFVFRIQAAAFGSCVGSRLYSIKVIAGSALSSKNNVAALRKR